MKMQKQNKIAINVTEIWNEPCVSPRTLFIEENLLKHHLATQSLRNQINAHNGVSKNELPMFC